MRISEKTVEINFCKGLPNIVGKDLFWFGLTQEQEARAGFDVCTKLNGTLFLFQIKASRVVLKNGARRFRAAHDQMQVLRNQATSKKRKVFYVFPSAGTTMDMCGINCFSRCSQLLDVSLLPAVIPLPLAKGKTTSRLSGDHYIDVLPGKATIHSDPFEVKLFKPDHLLAILAEDHNAVRSENSASNNEFSMFWESISRIPRDGMYGAVLI